MRIRGLGLVLTIGIIAAGTGVTGSLCRAVAAGTPEAAAGPDWGNATLGFINMLAEGNYADACARFNTSMSNLVHPRKMAKIWTDLQNEVGGYQDMGLPTEVEMSGHHVVDVPVRFQWRTMIFRVAWDSVGAVSRFDFLPVTEDAMKAPDNVPAHDEEIPIYRDSTATAAPRITPTATLSLPQMRGLRLPAVILISTRDRKSLTDVTSGFLSRNIAVLRWEHPFEPGRWAAGSEPAVRFMRNRPEIDGRRIFVVGESADSLVMDRKSKKVAGVVQLPDLRLGSDDVAKISSWVMGGKPVGE